MASASISTHVLDTESGVPATGVRVQLFRGSDLLGEHRTDGDGRVADLAGATLGPGVYRLVFHPPSPFFRRLELELELDGSRTHYHVPLLVSPYQCTTYRGS